MIFVFDHSRSLLCFVFNQDGLHGNRRIVFAQRRQLVVLRLAFQGVQRATGRGLPKKKNDALKQDETVRPLRTLHVP